MHAHILGAQSPVTPGQDTMPATHPATVTDHIPVSHHGDTPHIVAAPPSVEAMESHIPVSHPGELPVIHHVPSPSDAHMANGHMGDPHMGINSHHDGTPIPSPTMPHIPEPFRMTSVPQGHFKKEVV